MSSPPGYVRAGSEGESVPGIRPVTLLAAQVVLTTALLVAAARELLLRAPPLYLAPLDLGMSARFWGLALGLGLGALAARRWHARAAAAIWSLAAIGVLSSAAPLAWSFAFADASRFSLLATLAMGVSGGALGVAAVSAIAWLTPHARALGLFVALLSPLPLAVMMFCGALALGAATQLGLAQAGAALGFALGLLAVAAAALELYLTRERPALSARVGAPVVALLCAGLALVRAELQLPHDEVRAYGGDVLAFAGGERQRLALVSHRSHFELYVDRTLKLSSVDAHRYAEALVHPALAVAASRRRILLLGGGTGVIEREILRWSGVETLTVVVTDRTLVELARRSPWLASASTAALADRRVRIVEAEPIVWLASNQARFDAVVADVEDPVGYRQSKHFTRHALGLVAAALADGGVASLQAPSPLTFPHAFASIRTTLLATGLTFAPYHAALPAIGDGGFFLFAPADTRSLLDRATEGAQHLPAGLRYVTPRALPSFFHFAADLGPALADGVPPNTLHTQPLVELYGDDHERQPER